jgi:hypothetical protein
MNPPASRDDTIAQLPALTLAWLREALTGEQVRCVAASYETDGSLGFTLEGSGVEVGLRLLARSEAPPDAVPVPDGWLVRVGDGGGDSWRPVAAWAARRLERVRSRFRVPILELFHEQECHEPYTFDAGLFHSRLGPLLVPGTTRYGAFVFVAERLSDDELVYEFESASGAVVLHLRQDPRAAGACFRTRHLSATLARDERSPDERRDSTAQVERYLGFLLSRCDTAGATFRPRVASRRAFVDDRPVFGAKLDGQFFVREIGHDYLNIYDAFWGLDLPADLLIHGDRECAGMATACPSPLRRMWTTPLDLRPDGSKAFRVAYTGLDDVDLIRGGEGRLGRCLDSMCHHDRDRLLVVMDTCVPQVIGDDIQRVVAAHATPGARPMALVSCRMEEHNPYRGPAAFWLEVLKQLSAEPGAAAPRGVNLVGYGRAGAPEMEELAGLLAASGVRVNALLFPGLTRDHAACFRSAALSVVNPWRYVSDLFAPIAEWSGVASMRLPMPYGVEGTRRWLEAVVRACSAGEEVTLPQPREALALEWQRLTRAAAEHEVALVTLSTQLELPADPLETRGIPLVPTLLEMGFRVTLHVIDAPAWRHVAQRRDPQAFLTEYRAGLGHPPGLSTRVWPGVDQAMSHLEQGPAALAYSELVADPRLAGIGLAQVGPEDFRPGFRAAVDTLRELVRRARDPFRRTYRRYLSRRTEP